VKKVSAPPPGDRPLKTVDRLISKAGLGSRSDARRFVKEGRVHVNDALVTDPDQWVDVELDRVTFDGAPLQQEKRVYIALYKPAGYLTTYKHPSGKATVYDLLPTELGYVFSVGRLDLDTSGLLLLTNDSNFAEEITNPEFKVPKTYCVRATTELSDEQLERLRRGIELEDGPTRPAIVSRIGDDRSSFEVTITEGRNRQVRRMVEALGSQVDTLMRVAVGFVTLEGLEIGSHRELTAAEVRAFMRTHSTAR
jgi:23S rRNA pseudouridine2605 synthase